MIGYRNSTTFTTIDIRSLAGFVVAVGLKGIHAIRLVDNDGKASPWAGRPGEALITERLLRNFPPEALEVDFDVSRSARQQNRFLSEPHADFGKGFQDG
jgi:hypothetical protein